MKDDDLPWIFRRREHSASSLNMEMPLSRVYTLAGFTFWIIIINLMKQSSSSSSRASIVCVVDIAQRVLCFNAIFTIFHSLCFSLFSAAASHYNTSTLVRSDWETTLLYLWQRVHVVDRVAQSRKMKCRTIKIQTSIFRRNVLISLAFSPSLVDFSNKIRFVSDLFVVPLDLIPAIYWFSSLCCVLLLASS